MAALLTRKSNSEMGTKEFIAFVAALMAVNALAIDAMLPALPNIVTSFGQSAGNHQQWIVTSYMLGMGTAQLIYGPLSDRFGRRPVLLIGLAIYAIFSLIGASALSFETLIAARILQGVGSAAARVLAITVVRDRYTGSQMAGVISVAFIVFLAVPIVAPTLGQVIMTLGSWRSIFRAFAIFASAIILWTAFRLPETLDPKHRIPVELRRIVAAFGFSLKHRQAVGYMLAVTVMMGGMFGYINSAQQVFATTFGVPKLFPIIFASTAVFMAAASLLNARIVGRLGARTVSHGALIGCICCAIIHIAVALAGFETLLTFVLFQVITMFGFGLVTANFTSLAMEPLGHLAGTGSAVQGFCTTVGGAMLGFVIGQQFDGTTTPIAVGFTATGLLSLACVLFAERGWLLTRRGPAIGPVGNI